MDRLTVPSPSNGFPFNWEDLDFALGQGVYGAGIIKAVEAIVSAYGSNIIVSGCEVTGSNISDGWVLLDGELIKVDAHTGTDDFFEKITTYSADGNKQTQAGGLEDAYQQNRATATASSGNLESPVTGNPLYLGKQFILDLIRNDADFAASTTNKGVVEKATTAEAQDYTGTADIYIDSQQVNLVKTINKGIFLPPISSGSTAIGDDYDIYNFTGAGPFSVTMPDPTSYKNRVITIYSSNATPTNISINNTATGESQEDQFYRTLDLFPGGGVGIQASFMSFISDGYKWMAISAYVESAACPYIYINGEYFEEILKNQIGIGNYKEEIIDITSVLKVGDNIIRLSEEKREVTFIDYLILIVDGVEFPLFTERKKLEIGDYFDYTIHIGESFNQATLKAKGYYIKD